MARPKRSRRSENSDLITIFAVALFITVAWFAEQPVALQTLTTVSAIAVVLGWWYLFRRPTTCKVGNRTRPYPCKNPVKGSFTACHLPDHKARKRRLIWARLRRRRVVEPVYQPVPRPSRPAAATHSTGRDVAGYWVEGSAYSATMLVCSIVGALGGVAGVVSTLHSLISGTAGG